MCDCDDKIEYGNVPKSLECDCDYLKPLSIHKLFLFSPKVILSNFIYNILL